MKFSLFITLLLAGFSSLAGRAQDSVASSPARILTLHELVGETIDSLEKEKYHLFPFWKKEEFGSAQVAMATDSSLHITAIMKDQSIRTLSVSKQDLANMHWLVSYHAGLIKEDYSELSTFAIDAMIKIIFELADKK
jgi:hypothetical protein